MKEIKKVVLSCEGKNHYLMIVKENVLFNMLELLKFGNVLFSIQIKFVSSHRDQLIREISNDKENKIEFNYYCMRVSILYIEKYKLK